MYSILDIEETLNGSVVREHMLKLYEKAYDCILGVTIRFDEDNMPYFEIDDCRRGIVLFSKSIKKTYAKRTQTSCMIG